jgi:tyrosyl-tRNA synthetase
VGVTEIDAGAGIVPALVASGLATSNGEARRAIEQGGIYVNGRRAEIGATLDAAETLAGGWTLVRKGKSNYRMLRLRGS